MRKVMTESKQRISYFPLTQMDDRMKAAKTN